MGLETTGPGFAKDVYSFKWEVNNPTIKGTESKNGQDCRHNADCSNGEFFKTY
jgi:hypothetical protein